MTLSVVAKQKTTEGQTITLRLQTTANEQVNITVTVKISGSGNRSSEVFFGGKCANIPCKIAFSVVFIQSIAQRNPIASTRSHE